MFSVVCQVVLPDGDDTAQKTFGRMFLKSNPKPQLTLNNQNPFRFTYATKHASLVNIGVPGGSWVVVNGVEVP